MRLDADTERSWSPSPCFVRSCAATSLPERRPALSNWSPRPGHRAVRRSIAGTPPGPRPRARAGPLIHDHVPATFRRMPSRTDRAACRRLSPEALAAASVCSDHCTALYSPDFIAVLMYITIISLHSKPTYHRGYSLRATGGNSVEPGGLQAWRSPRRRRQDLGGRRWLKKRHNLGFFEKKLHFNIGPYCKLVKTYSTSALLSQSRV